MLSVRKLVCFYMLMHIIRSMEIQLTEQGRARFGYKNLNEISARIAIEEAAVEVVPVQESRLHRLVAPISALVEKIRIIDEA